MLQLKNDTPFKAQISVFPDPSGVDTLYVALKATFDVTSRGLQVSEEQAPLVLADQHYAEGASIELAGEVHPLKPATDVVIVGHAYAPEGKASPRFDASFTVGAISKTIAVFGPRTWKAGIVRLSPTSPEPVARVPLTFERAYGGQLAVEGGGFQADMRNPVGAGFVGDGKRRTKDIEGMPLPDLEYPKQLITSVSDRPAPAATGFVAPSWLPRASYAGTYDDAWLRSRAPYYPTDFDPRFFCAAPPDQIYPGRLVGGEPVDLVHLSPDGRQRFTIPVVHLEGSALVAGAAASLRFEMETLLLQPDRSRASLLWRAALECDKRALKIERVDIGLAAPVR